MSGKLDQTSGSELGANGDKYAICLAGTTTTISNHQGRVCRVLVSSGTGAITIYDALSATGTPLFTSTGTAIAAVGGATQLDCPVLVGITVVVGATTAFTVIFV